MTLKHTAAELQQFLEEEFPQTSVTVAAVDETGVRVRQAVAYEHLRPGGTVSGPTMMAVADCAAYIAILARLGIVPLAVTTNLNINFLRKPAAERAIVGVGSLLKLGRRLAVVEVRVYSEDEPEPVAHATVTYAIPPDRPRY